MKLDEVKKKEVVPVREDEKEGRRKVIIGP